MAREAGHFFECGLTSAWRMVLVGGPILAPHLQPDGVSARGIVFALLLDQGRAGRAHAVDLDDHRFGLGEVVAHRVGRCGEDAPWGRDLPLDASPLQVIERAIRK